MRDLLLNFWPSEQNVNDCIKSEAETIDPAVFFAVHQKMTFIRQPCGGNAAPSKRSEDDLLKEFLSEKNIESGYLIVPIIGSSGVGKSHVIRWLDERIRAEHSVKERIIIRIPKSASFRQALDLILRELPGSDYDSVRHLLKSAHNRLTPTSAVVNLRAKLVIACREEADVLCRQLRNDEFRDFDKKRTAQARLSHLQLLPAFLDDAEVSSHLEAGALGRIARRAVQGLDPSGKNSEEEVFQFREEDVDVSKVNIQQTGGIARNYCTILNRSSGRSECVTILNQMVDSAVRQLFDLGTMTLHDVFIQIRSSLAREGRGLVLLIEDFASLTGVQAELIDGIIATSTPATPLCLVRAALAVTEGYEGYLNRDTVRTRAKFEWRIEDAPYAKREDAMEHILDLVGAYLNAARLGCASLNEIYGKSPSKSNWLPNYSDCVEQDQKTAYLLEPFGKCSNGYSLFPFNKAALKNLADKRLLRGDKLEFHPRNIINYILRETLDCRTVFMNKRFPPENFDGLVTAQARLGAEILLSSSLQREQPATRNRYVAFLAYWGDNPESWDAVKKIDSRLYQALGLQPLVVDVIVPPEPVMPTDTSRPDIDPAINNIGADNEPEAVVDLCQAIQKWRAGEALTSRLANKLRGYVWQALKEYVDWNLFLCNPKEDNTYYLKFVYIPRAPGGAPTCHEDLSVATVCTEKELDNATKVAEVELELSALVRRCEYKNWDYPQATKDIAYYSNLLERLHGQAVEFITTRLFRSNYDAVPALSAALTKGAQIFNLGNSFTNVRKDRVNAMFEKIPNSPAEILPDTTWGAVRRDVSANREKLKDQLLMAVSARAGSGKVIYAVDAVRLLQGEDSSPAEVPEDLPELRKTLSSFRQLNNVNQETRVRLGPWVKGFEEAFGKTVDRHQFVETMRNTISEAGSDYRNSGGDKDQLRKAIIVFKDAQVMEQYNLARDFLSAKKEDQWILALSRLDDVVLLTVEKVITLTSGFLSETSKHVCTKIEEYGLDGGVGAVEANLQLVMTEMIKDFSKYQGMVSHDAD
jgi:hypothetical protein